MLSDKGVGLKHRACALALVLGAVPFSVQARECEIDKAMQATAKAIIKAETDYIEDGIRKEGMETIEKMDAKEGACLPSLDDLGASITGSIPGFGGGLSSIFSAIKDMACNAADGLIKDTVNSVDYSVGDPYGIASVGIGGSTSGSSVDVGSYDMSEVIKDVALDKAGDAINSGTSSVPRFGKQGAGGSSAGSDSAKKGVLDAFKGL